MTWATGLRAGYGSALIAFPAPILRRAAGRPADARARVVVRVLGARHVLQAAALARWPTHRLMRAAAAIDATHAASALALAALDRRRRRAALIDAGVAGAFALIGLR